MKTQKTAEPGYAIDIKEEDQKRSERSRYSIEECGSFYIRVLQKELTDRQ